MRLTKVHLTKHTALVGLGLFTVVVLSLGTASAAYQVSSVAKSQPKPALPKQVSLIEQGKKIIVKPADLGWTPAKVDQATLVNKVTEVADSTQQAPVDAKIITQNGGYVVSPSAPGERVDVTKAVKMIKSGLFAGKATINLPVVPVAPAVIEASLQPQLQQLKAQQAAAIAAAAAKAKTKVAAPTSCAANPVGRKLILVSISRQHLWGCNGPNQAYDTAITSGAYLAGMATPTGTWHIYSKSANIHLIGPGYNYPVSYWMPFYSDYGFHDSSWQTFPYGSAQYASDGSHGCVHVPAAAMAWLYNWAPVGTTVTIKG